MLVWALALVAAVLVIVRTPFTADLSAFLPAAPDARQHLLIEQISSGVPSRTLMLGIGGGDAKRRADASRALASALRASGRFAQVANGQTEGFEAFGEWLFEHRYALSPAVTPERFTPAGLREGIHESLSLLGTPAGQSLKGLLDRDPTGETTRIGEALIPARAPRASEGVWAARDGSRALLMATLKGSGGDLDAQAATLAEIDRAFAPHAAQGLALEVSGAPVFAVDSRARIEREVHRLAIAGTLVMGALLLASFASLRALGVAFVPVATGVLVGIMAVALGFGTVHGMTLGFGATLIGESVDYAIYYLIQANRPARDGQGWRHWLHTSWPTVRLGLFTSVCGFAALVFSGFAGLAQLGVFSVAGLVAAALTARFVLPVVMPDGAAAAPSSRAAGWRRLLGRAARRAAAWLPRLRVPVLVVGALCAVLLHARDELWRADLASLSPVPRAALERDERLRTDLAATDTGTLVVVQAADVDATLRATEAVAARLDALVDEGVIGGYDAVTRLLPSRATQDARRAALPDAGALRSVLEQATHGTPLPAARLAPFVGAVEAARVAPPITLADVRRSAVAPVVDALLTVRADGSAAALLPLQPVPGKPLDAAAITQALKAAPGAQWFDIGHELRTLYGRYLREAQLQALAGAAGVVLLMGLWLRSTRRLLAVCLPLVLAVLLAMGLLAALGEPLGILHLVGLLLVVAVGSNYALFFDMLHHEGDPGTASGEAADPDDTLASLLLANLTTVASFGLLAMSTIPVLSSIGRVVAPGALLALVLAAVFAPRKAGPS